MKRVARLKLYSGIEIFYSDTEFFRVTDLSRAFR